MTDRRFASGIAGAAGLIAVTTLLARIAGFARILVFTEAVRAGGVGGIYQSVNAIPNVMFEIAAGGILAAVAVPLIAAPARGRASATGPTTRHPCCCRGPCSCSCRCRPALAVAAPISSLLVGQQRPAGRRGRRHAAADLRRAGAALRRWASSYRDAAGPPPLPGGRAGAAASVDRRARVLPLVRRRSSTARRPRRWSATRRSGCSAGAPRSASSCCRCRCIVPAMRTGWRWRPALRLPPRTPAGSAPSPAPGSSRCSPSRRPCSPPCGSSKQPGDTGTFTVYTYVQAVYLLPYAVLAVPVATSAFPALAAERAPAREDVTHDPRGGRCGPCSCSPRLSVGVLVAAAAGRSARSSRCSTPGAATARRAARAGRPARDAHRLRPGPGRLRPERPADPGPLRARPAHRCRHRSGHRVVHRGPASPRRARGRARARR